MIRLIFCLLYAVVFLVVGCIPAFFLFLIGKKNPALKAKAYHKMVRFGMRCELAIAGVTWTVEGEENLMGDTPVLYVGNHRSYFDVVLAYCLFPSFTGFVSKVELKKVPLLSIFMKNIGCLFLDRENIREGLKTILEGIQMIKDGQSLCIYPEGTRNKADSDLELLPFHEGSMKLAQKSGCPVIPIAMRHSADVLEAHAPFVRPTKINVKIGKPIYLKDLTPEQKKFPGSYMQSVLLEMLKTME